MKKQFHLPVIELMESGFGRKYIKGDDLNHEKMIYEFRRDSRTLYYNPEEEIYTWYLGSFNSLN